MALRHRKLRVYADPACIDLITMLQPLRAKYPDLIHFAISWSDDNMCLYVQNKEYVSSVDIGKLWQGHLDVKDISPYTKVEGELQQEWRSKPLRGKKRSATTTNTNAVFVHPLGEESLQHITSEHVANLLQQMLNFGVFFQFGAKLYQLEQNINFRTHKRNKYVRVRSGGEWVTVSKSEAYDRILENLVELTREAVCMYREGIPELHINHFNTYMQTILEFKNSSNPGIRKEYEIARNKGLDKIAVGVNERLKRLHAWGGKRIRLV